MVITSSYVLTSLAKLKRKCMQFARKMHPRISYAKLGNYIYIYIIYVYVCVCVCVCVCSPTAGIVD